MRFRSGCCARRPRTSRRAGGRLIDRPERPSSIVRPEPATAASRRRQRVALLTDRAHGSWRCGPRARKSMDKTVIDFSARWEEATSQLIRWVREGKLKYREKPGSNHRVEYAIRLRGGEDGDGPLWLPIDVRFPTEDYERLVAASERGVGSCTWRPSTRPGRSLASTVRRGCVGHPTMGSRRTSVE